MAKKNSIFSGKNYDPKEPDVSNNWTYTPRVNEEFWASYYEKSQKSKAKNKIRYAEKLAKQGTATYKGKTYSGESNRMRYLMQQLSEEDRRRLRKGIYDDSETQRQIAEQMIEKEDMSDAELARLKEENEDLWRRRNTETLRKRGGKLPPPKMPF